MYAQLAREILEGLGRRIPETPQAHADAVASGGVLPGVIPLAAAMQVMSSLWSAFSNWQLEIQTVSEQGQTVAVDFMWGGLHSADLALPMPGLAPVPPTGKSVWVRDRFVFTFDGGKMRSVAVESPVSGGIPGMLGQLGLTL